MWVKIDLYFSHFLIAKFCWHISIVVNKFSIFVKALPGIPSDVPALRTRCPFRRKNPVWKRLKRRWSSLPEKRFFTCGIFQWRMFVTVNKRGLSHRSRACQWQRYNHLISQLTREQMLWKPKCESEPLTNIHYTAVGTIATCVLFLGRARL